MRAERALNRPPAIRSHTMAWRSTLVRSLARLIGLRDYDGAKQNNHVWGGGRRVTASSDANVDLSMDRSDLRERSRAAYQNHSSARAMIDAKVGLVVSSGIDIEPDTGDADTDDALKSAWLAWVDQADASGLSCLWDMQRQAYRSELMAGEFLWVLVDLDADGRVIPAALMAIEPDRLAWNPVSPIAAGAQFVDGVEIDRYGRPIAYHILDGDSSGMRSPLGGSTLAGSGGRPIVASISTSGTKGTRYPASQILHGFELLRPGMVRGEPALAPVLNTLRQEQQLVETELTAAKISAAHAVAVLTDAGSWPEGGDPNTGTDDVGAASYDFAPGTVSRLAPGEKLEIVKNERPSQQISPFRDMLRGDLAGAMSIPKRLIDRDVSKANYSSMRADMLDTRRQLDPVQHRFGRVAALEVYLRILPQLAVSAGLSIPPAGTPERREFERAKIMPDGWAYVDPEKDFRAATLGIAAGLTTWQDEMHARGKDPRSVWKQLKAEQDALLVSGLKIDLSGSNAPAPASSYGDESEDEGEKPAAKEDEAKKKGDTKDDSMTTDERQRMERMERIVESMALSRQAGVTVEQRISMDSETAEIMGRAIGTNQPATVVNVPAPQITVEAARVEIPQPLAPVVNIAPAQVNVAAPVVHVAAPSVTVENEIIVPQRKVIAKPNPDGSVTMTPQES